MNYRLLLAIWYALLIIVGISQPVQSRSGYLLEALKDKVVLGDRATISRVVAELMVYYDALPKVQKIAIDTELLVLIRGLMREHRTVEAELIYTPLFQRFKKFKSIPSSTFDELVKLKAEGTNPVSAAFVEAAILNALEKQGGVTETRCGSRRRLISCLAQSQNIHAALDQAKILLREQETLYGDGSSRTASTIALILHFYEELGDTSSYLETLPELERVLSRSQDVGVNDFPNPDEFVRFLVRNHLHKQLYSLSLVATRAYGSAAKKQNPILSQLKIVIPELIEQGDSAGGLEIVQSLISQTKTINSMDTPYSVEAYLECSELLCELKQFPQAVKLIEDQMAALSKMPTCLGYMQSALRKLNETSQFASSAVLHERLISLMDLNPSITEKYDRRYLTSIQAEFAYALKRADQRARAKTLLRQIGDKCIVQSEWKNAIVGDKLLAEYVHDLADCYINTDNLYEPSIVFGMMTCRSLWQLEHFLASQFAYLKRFELARKLYEDGLRNARADDVKKGQLVAILREYRECLQAQRLDAQAGAIQQEISQLQGLTGTATKVSGTSDLPCMRNEVAIVQTAEIVGAYLRQRWQEKNIHVSAPVTIRFRIDYRGNRSMVSISKSSGSRKTDKAALNCVQTMPTVRLVDDGNWAIGPDTDLECTFEDQDIDVAPTCIANERLQPTNPFEYSSELQDYYWEIKQELDQSAKAIDFRPDGRVIVIQFKVDKKGVISDLVTLASRGEVDQEDVILEHLSTVSSFSPLPLSSPDKIIVQAYVTDFHGTRHLGFYF